MKKLICIIVVLAMTLAAMPASLAAPAAEPKLIADDAAIDTDGSDGYSGDYVVIYNPATSASDSKSTGNLTGLIETEIEPHPMTAAEACPELYRIDVDAALMQQAAEAGIPDKPIAGEAVKDSFEVGDTHSFMILNYSPDGTFMQFKVLAKGEHCYIWTPTSTNSNVYPLDSIDPAYAQMAADEFDSKFPLMQSSFGEHSNGTSGDGRLNMLYYNIDDGWQPGQGYIGGYFYALDLYLNGMPILNIDTYPGVHYVDGQGVVHDDITRSFGTMVHEYQHLIHFSEVGATAETWENEMMSAAAEEICYPGSSISSRIQSWTNYFYSEHQDWNDPPAEFEYMANMQLHNGFSMYDWNNDLEMDDLLILYAQVSLFAQYIYTQYGNTTFRGIMQQMKNGSSFVQGFENVTGQGMAEFTGNFRTALTANTAPDVLGGVYGFRLQEGYDPSQYHDIDNLYDLLGPVVFTGSSCSLKGGGAICVKPVGGVFNPPTGANSGLRYYGVTRSVTEPEPVPVESVDIDLHEITLHVGETAQLTAIIYPANASSYEIFWQSTAEGVATVEGSGLNAVVTAVAPGTAQVCFDLHDASYENDMLFSAYCVVNVVENEDHLPGDVDMDGEVTISDALLAMRFAMGIITLTDLQQQIGDVDGDGEVTISDALLIMRASMGIIEL